MCQQNPLDGWSYKQDGQAFGPVSTAELKGLLRAGQIQPQQAVWQQVGNSVIFIPSSTAVGFADSLAKAAEHSATL